MSVCKLCQGRKWVNKFKDWDTEDYDDWVLERVPCMECLEHSATPKDLELVCKDCGLSFCGSMTVLDGKPVVICPRCQYRDFHPEPTNKWFTSVCVGCGVPFMYANKHSDDGQSEIIICPACQHRNAKTVLSLISKIREGNTHWGKDDE